MKTAEAIIELTRYLNEPYSKLHPYFSEATRLSLKAMLRLERERKHGRGNVAVLLPGEDPYD